MTVSTAAAFTAQFAAFATDQAKVGLVPLAVNGSDVEYGFDDAAERKQPDPLLKLRSVPLYVSEMLIASGEGEGEVIQQTSLYSEWRGMQEATNRFSDEIEVLNQEVLRFGPAMRRPAYWKKFSSRAEAGGGSDLTALIDAAIVGLLLNENNCGNVGSIPSECVKYFNRAVHELLRAGRYDSAAMLLESATAANLSFLSGMEFFGRRTANALARSLTARKKDASVDHLLARGIWYGWFDKSGVSLESFHLASAEQDFDVGRYGDCAAHYVRMIAARLRRPKLTGDDWKWISEMLNITASMWEEFGKGSEKIDAALKLAEQARSI
jgi:hypothetical protein